MEEEEVEWESKLADNIRTFCATSSGAIAIVVDGTDVRKQNGLVMISGNYDNMNGSTSTYIYDYTNGSVRKGPEMKVARFNHASVTLQTGDVAVFGGYSSKIDIRYLSHYEVFNVESNSFSKIGNMIEKRNRPAAVTLPTGVVLIIGGGNGYRWLNTCEFFNPADKRFSPSKAKMRIGRAGHTASFLPNGKVLACGGDGGYNGSPLQTTEIYDPSTDSFSDGPLMTAKRRYHTATTLADGRIIITGGEGELPSKSTELYDPVTETFTAGPKMLVGRATHFSALLPDGRVLIGCGWTIGSERTTELYDPITNSFTEWVYLSRGICQASASNF